MGRGFFKRTHLAKVWDRHRQVVQLPVFTHQNHGRSERMNGLWQTSIGTQRFVTEKQSRQISSQKLFSAWIKHDLRIPLDCRSETLGLFMYRDFSTH
jgi:hypothetical protein